MQLDAPDFGAVMDSAEAPAERTMQLDAPDFGRPQIPEPPAQPAPPGPPPPPPPPPPSQAERTMEMAPPTFKPLEESDETSDPLERTMQYDEPDVPEAEIDQTIVVPPPSLEDPNAVTLPLQAFKTPERHPLDMTVDDVDADGQTIPLRTFDRNDITMPMGTPGVFPSDDPGEISHDELGLDFRNAQTIPIPQPDLQPPSGSIPSIGPSSGVIPSVPTTGSGVIGGPLDNTRAEAQPDLTGQLLGNRYQIVSKIGQGGMGTVYKAEHTLMGRTVAIKVLNRDLVRSEESVARFKREIKTMAQFQHPNVVRLFDAGTTSAGNLYMAMEFVEGINLAQVLAREQRLALDRFSTFFAQVLLGVAMGHGRGIVHRDLKTENMLICSPKPGQEQIKIMDFGIAKLLGGGDDSDETAKKNVFLTTERVAIGTPEYMSPEQASGGANVDHRSDLYSLGVVAFELLTGRLPFDADSPVGFIGKHILEPPLTFEEAQPGLGLPASVEAFVQKALQKDPADRYPSAEAMLDALEEAVPPELRVMVSQVRVKTLGASQTGEGLTYSQARKGAPQSSTLEAGGAPGPDSPQQVETIAKALKVTIAVCAVLFLIVVGLLVRRAVKPASVDDRLAAVMPEVRAALDARDWEAAKKPLNALLSDLEPDEKAPVAKQLKEVERVETAVSSFKSNLDKLGKAAETFKRAWDQEKLPPAEQAFKQITERHADDASLRAELTKLELEDVVKKADAPPDLAALKNQLEVLRIIDRALALTQAEKPEYQSALNQLDDALKRVAKKSAVAARLQKLRDEAQAGAWIQQAQRKVNNSSEEAELKAAAATLSKARRLVRERSLRPELSERIDEVERRIASKQKTADQQARENEAREAIAQAKLAETKAAYAKAVGLLKKAKGIVDKHSLPGVWSLAEDIERLETLDASLRAHQGLPKIPPKKAPLAKLQAALTARKRYLKEYPKGHAWDGVEGEVKTLAAAIASRRGAQRAEEVRQQLTKAREALARGDEANALALAEAAATLAKRHGIDPGPAQTLAKTIRSRQQEKRVKQRLKDFVKVGEIYMGKYEVTNLDYLKFCLATGKAGGAAKVKGLWPVGWRKAASAKKPWARMFPSGTAQRPAGGVSFQDAQAFCAWRSKSWGVTVRLPTRDEWIAAASSGFDKRTYPWGPTWNPARAVFQRTKTEDASGPRAKRWEMGATKQGILHMAGNVSEWTTDLWIDPETGKDRSARVLMGGNYRSFRKEMLQVRYKGEKGGITEKKPQWGFRVVIDPR